MKPQDVLFFIVLIVLVYKRNPKILAAAGLVSLVTSIPLFTKWVFFTAERLTWYAAAFFLASIIIYLYRLKNKHI